MNRERPTIDKADFRVMERKVFQSDKNQIFVKLCWQQNPTQEGIKQSIN